MPETAVENHTCDGCGQLDNHPMIHIGPYVWQKDERTTVVDPSFHFDCLPEELEREFGLDVDQAQHAVTRAAIRKAKDGVHGDKLREFILKQPSDNETEES